MPGPGFGLPFRDEPNLKVHGGIALLAIAAGFYFDITSAEWG
jgi:hypothetical protein